MPKPFHKPGSSDSPIDSAAKTSVPPALGAPAAPAAAEPLELDQPVQAAHAASAAIVANPAVLRIKFRP